MKEIIDNKINNYSTFGFTLQKIICDKYRLIPSQKAKAVFDSSYNVNYYELANEISNEIFEKIGLKPIECTTLKNDDGIDIKYNFILNDNSTLSIRTNYSNDKIAPREVGQAGFEKLNFYFSSIYEKEIVTQDDIKKLITEKTHLVLPTFISFLLDADYVVWINKNGKDFDYHIINGSSTTNIDFSKKHFSFTKDYSNWNESTTLKYKGVSIAEIQVHKKRSFKFRFIMNNFIPLIITKKKNNETLGITAEKTICDFFNLKYPNNMMERSSIEIQYQLNDIIGYAFEQIPTPIEYTGNMQGDRGKNSKSSYDFILTGNKTLSLKTNYGEKVCPPEVGQPGDKTCYEYFGHLTECNYINKDIFKEMVFKNIDKMIPIYLSHLFDSDYLLRIKEANDYEIEEYGYSYTFDIFKKDYGHNLIWEKEKFSFSKKNIREWKESNTVSYNNIPLGEFQVHNNRNCFKFRFIFNNLIKIIKNN